MTKVTLFRQNLRIQKQEATQLKEKSTEKTSLAKSILAVKNHLIKLSSNLSGCFISHKNTESSATHPHRGNASESRAVLANKFIKNFMLRTSNDNKSNSNLSVRFISHKDTGSPTIHFHRGSASEGRAVLTNKVVKNFMLQTLNDMDIRGNASRDPAYASQTREATLSAVYSKNKDQYCKLLISKGIKIGPFLKEIGEAAQNAGLPGTTKNGIFTPSGAGANPFITPLMSSANCKYPYMFINQHQQVSFKIYAEKIIMTEVTPLFNECAMPTPQTFQLTLENIANKYIQNTN